MQHKLSIGLGVGGFVVLLVGVILGWVAIPKIIESKVKSETQLIPGSYIYEKWEDLPIPIRLNVYLFNVTNAQDLMDGFTTKPILEELGPYVWTQRRLKMNITHNEDEDTVTYRQNISYFFDKELSGGRSDDDEFTTVNLPLMAVANILSVKFPRWSKAVANVFFKGEKFMSTYKPKDVLFDGVDAPLYEFLLLAAKNVLNLDIEVPKEFQDGKFGWYLNKNNTDDGLWEVYRGKKDSSKFAVIKSIDGSSSLTHWTNRYCNMINGTDGTMFPPFFNKDTKLRGYSPDICRSVYAEFTKEVKFEGISGYRYALSKEFYSSPYINHENQCFCTRPPRPLNDTCDMSGAFRIFTCKAGLPLTLSKPHFLDADEILLDMLEGLKPDPELHDSYFDVEPNTGFPLRAYKRLQLGIEIQPLPIGGAFEEIPHMMFPIAWVAEEGVLDDELIKELKSRLVTPLLLADIGKWTLVAIGILLIIGSIGIFMYQRRKRM